MEIETFESNLGIYSDIVGLEVRVWGFEGLRVVSWKFRPRLDMLKDFNLMTLISSSRFPHRAPNLIVRVTVI